MGLIETHETNQFSFDRFAAHSFYTEINRSLVQRALAFLTKRPTADPLTIVDMACGTGAITRLIAESLAQQGRQARIIGVDPSAEALRSAQKSLEEMGASGEFIQGEAADLSNLVLDADAVFFCNAIHLLPEKLSALQQIVAILAPGGIFACNSAFYDGAHIEGTERFTRLWIRRAVGWLRKERSDVLVSRGAKTVTMQWLTPEDYASLLKESGLSDVEGIQERVGISLDALRDLGHYWLFIEGALPGIPLEAGAAALGAAVYQAGHELGMTEVPRLWLQILATKAKSSQ